MESRSSRSRIQDASRRRILVTFWCKPTKDTSSTKEYWSNQSWMDVVRMQKLSVTIDPSRYHILSTKRGISAELGDTIQSLFNNFKTNRKISVNLAKKMPVVNPLYGGSTSSAMPVSVQRQVPKPTFSGVLNGSGRKSSNSSIETLPIPGSNNVRRTRSPIDADMLDDDEEDNNSQFGVDSIDNRAVNVKQNALRRMQGIPPKYFLQAKVQWQSYGIIEKGRFNDKNAKLGTIIAEMFNELEPSYEDLQ